jgi:hypothetical protein
MLCSNKITGTNPVQPNGMDIRGVPMDMSLLYPTTSRLPAVVLPLPTLSVINGNGYLW